MGTQQPQTHMLSARARQHKGRASPALLPADWATRSGMRAAAPGVGGFRQQAADGADDSVQGHVQHGHAARAAHQVHGA